MYVDRFVPTPSSCVSAPIYMLGIGRLLPSSYGLLSDYPRRGRRDLWGVLYLLCPSCSLGVVNMLPKDTVAVAPSVSGTRG